MMKVAVARPPNFERIAAVFPRAGNPGVIFAFGDTIFNPSGGEITPALFAHEGVHGERQGSDPEAWWERYLADKAFRLAEEIPAHQAEYRTFCAQGHGRTERRRYLAIIAGRLASPLYGHLIGFAEAKEVIQAAAA